MIFQSTHPSGVRRGGAPTRSKGGGYFNPRTPVGCDPCGRHAGGACQQISIHAPQWGATMVLYQVAMSSPISIHAPQWGATFRSLSRFGLPTISIHAPQWGATLSSWPDSDSDRISIHAPQWGATATCLHTPEMHADFNPRTPVGCDWRAGRRITLPPRISIHAPQWGATAASASGTGCTRISIHAPQWGATCRAMGYPSTRPDFNPRTPVGCDELLRYRPVNHRDFNPRTPVGCDHMHVESCVFQCLFQSTHPSGVRRQPQARLRRHQDDFNPRTPVGCD